MMSKCLPASAVFSASGLLRSAAIFATRLPMSCLLRRCRIATSCPAFKSSFTKRRPMNKVPPMTRTLSLAGAWRFAPLVVILTPKVCDNVLSAHPAQRVLQLHQLNENVVLGIKPWGGHRRLEIERQPLLNALHAGPLSEVEEKHEVEHQRCRQNRIAAQEIDLDLHRIAEPPEDIDVIPAFFGVATWRIVVDAHRVI